MERVYWFTVDVAWMLAALRKVCGVSVRAAQGRAALVAAADEVCRRLEGFDASVRYRRCHGGGGVMRLSLRLPVFPTGWWWMGRDFAAAAVAAAAGRADVADELCSMMRSAVEHPQAGASVGEVD
ncbi:MAG: hypothetical protein NC418_03020 [Muribaculaceae bacterium]|nr:hypothetical protein [Muribaculaceae bacterium]